MWHFVGLWTTFVAGFSYMFLGFEIHDGGHSLASTVAITRPRLRHLRRLRDVRLLPRLPHGTDARAAHPVDLRRRRLVDRLARSSSIAPLGWVGYQAGLLVQLWNGFYGWGAIFTLTLVFAG